MLIIPAKGLSTGVTRALRETPAIMHFNFYDRAKEDVEFESEMGSLVNDIRPAFHMAPSTKQIAPSACLKHLLLLI